MDAPERKRRGPLTWLAGMSRRFWVSAAVILPVLYAASIGPACWVEQHVVFPYMPNVPNEMDRTEKVSGALDSIFRPLVWCRDNGPKPIASAYWWYLGLWVEVHPD